MALRVDVAILLTFFGSSAVGLDLNVIKRQNTATPVVTTTTKASATTTAPLKYVIVDPGAQMIQCPAACGTGWAYYNGSCYKKFAKSSTFSAAESDCVSNGGHLASIHSQAENDALRRNVDGNQVVALSAESWIGLTKSGSLWVWTDGSSATAFVNWGKTPSGSDTCGQFFSDSPSDATYNYKRGLWNTYGCTKTLPSYICKKRA